MGHDRLFKQRPRTYFVAPADEQEAFMNVTNEWEEIGEARGEVVFVRRRLRQRRGELSCRPHSWNAWIDRPWSKNDHF